VGDDKEQLGDDRELIGDGSDRLREGPIDAQPGGGRYAGGMRYTRRRILILGGAFAAGVVGVVAGLRQLVGAGGSPSGGTLSDAFGPFPVRSVEGVPDVSPSEWAIVVDGLVERPFTLEHAAWTALPRRIETVDFHCVEGWTVNDVRWGGVVPAALLDRAGVKPTGTWVVVHAYGNDYESSLPIDLMRHAQTLLADRLDGEPLPAKHGGPVRLVVPVQLGYKSVKWVARLEVTDVPRPGYWERRGYPVDAPVEG